MEFIKSFQSFLGISLGATNLNQVLKLEPALLFKNALFFYVRNEVTENQS
jgi:hypothetical protein